MIGRITMIAAAAFVVWMLIGMAPKCGQMSPHGPRIGGAILIAGCP